MVKNIFSIRVATVGMASVARKVLLGQWQEIMEGKMRVQISLLILQVYNGNWLNLTYFTVFVRGQDTHVDRVFPVRG